MEELANWPDKIGDIQYVINNTFHSSIKASLSKLLLGYDKRNHLDSSLIRFLNDLAKTTLVAEILEETRNRDGDIAIKASDKLKQYNKLYYDKHHKTPFLYITHSFVLLHYSASSRTILRRIFALTPTAYKFLEIGIAVEPISYVEITIGDTRIGGNRIVLPQVMWTAFVKKRVDIEQLMQSPTPSSSLVIQGLQTELVKIHDVDNVKLSLCKKCLYTKPSILFMLELEQCVEHVYCELCQYTNGVSEKFKYFVTYLR
ncbi:hypothetical protein ALC57_07776 [Trachymyrmex cornetzi]|uniref:Uncharacterized protein n=1 Tax=Trachymyrmex cornetzi TaxID=471704 RepID=A0A151J7J8_9HYME|nr:hypothetical protein ALC57_07776 [Trachymyrmex cornetzi]